MLSAKRIPRLFGKRFIITGLTECILYTERRTIHWHIAFDLRLTTIRKQCVECCRQIFSIFTVLGYTVRASRQYYVA